MIYVFLRNQESKKSLSSNIQAIIADAPTGLVSSVSFMSDILRK